MTVPVLMPGGDGRDSRRTGPGRPIARVRRALGGLAAAFAIVTVLVWGILSLTWTESPVNINVRWTSDVVDAQRLELERRFQLTSSQQTEGTTWAYELADTSTANIRALIQHQQVDDTEHLNRIRYRPELAQDRLRQILLASVAIGSFGSVVLLLLAGRRTAWSPSICSVTSLVRCSSTRWTVSRSR